MCPSGGSLTNLVFQ